jgi:nitrile hydratase accessory protein
MFTRFEEYAASKMLGHADSPPRSQGKLLFNEDWQRTLFGLTLAVSKEGHFEWEDFRKHLIRSIGDWEQLDCESQPPWDYYERFLQALVQVLEQHGVLTASEVDRQLGSTSLGPVPRLSDMSSHA